MSASRADTIEQKLRDALSPVDVLVKDQSHLHAGHEGAKDGKGHFDVKIVSETFAGLNRIARHRMVYDALGNFMNSDIHALRITAITPAEQ